MKKTIRERFREFFESLIPVVKRYPVEMALMLFTFICLVLEHEKVWGSAELVDLILVPIFFTVAYVLNTLTRNAGRGRWAYYLCWLPGVVLWVMHIAVLWAETQEFWITVCVLCPLAVLLCRRAVSNRMFISDILTYFEAGIISGIFVCVAFGLFLAIFFSVVYIFHIMEGWERDVLFYSSLTAYLLLQPLFFFVLLDRMLGREVSGVRMLGFLLNWIVTPALLIYTAILYLYALKITVTWSLPEGNVAYMVFGFTMLALIVKALRLSAFQPRCDWFFSRFSLIALPPLALFWVGTIYRIGEYGLTEPRVWLMICGLLMTLCIALFALERTGRYIYFCAVAFVVFAAVAYIPSMRPKQVALDSQAGRVERIAGELGLFGSRGKIVDEVTTVDTSEYKRYNQLYESTRYLYDKDDTVALNRIFGFSDPEELLARLPDEAAYYARNGFPHEGDWDESDGSSYFHISYDEEEVNVDITEYKELTFGSMYYNSVTEFRNDSLVLSLSGKPDWRISVAELLNRQLRKIGCPEGGCPTQETLDKCKKQMLSFEEENRLIVFNNMSFSRNKSDSLKFEDANVLFVLTK